jgi:hypothetical protein
VCLLHEIQSTLELGIEIDGAHVGGNFCFHHGRKFSLFFMFTILILISEM